MRVEVEVDEHEVLGELSTTILRRELEARPDSEVFPPEPMLEKVYVEFARRGDAPQCLRDYIYNKLGRIL